MKDEAPSADGAGAGADDAALSGPSDETLPVAGRGRGEPGAAAQVTIREREEGEETLAEGVDPTSRTLLLDEDRGERAAPAASWAGGIPAAPLDGRFALGSRLGKGGMGEVFSARDELLNRRVAVKVLDGKLASHQSVLARFLREAQVTAQLSHPNVVPVHGLEVTSEGRPALSMKLIHGETFRDYAERCRAAMGTTAWDEERHGLATRLEHFLKVCDAMAYSHNRGVLHRDLKPHNVMLGPFHEVYVMDWGLARLIGEEGGEPAPVEEGPVATSFAEFAEMETQYGEVMGSPMYLSPEQARGENASLTPASDQYSLGLMLFELLTFEPPRDNGPVREVVERAKRGGRRPFEATALGATLPRPLRAIVDRATATEPSARYPSVEAFAEDIRHFARGDAVSAFPEGPARRVWRVVQRRPLQLLAAVLLLVITAAGAVTFSLVHTIDTERRAAERSHRLAEIVARVTQHVHGFDGLLFRVEVLLEGLASATVDRLALAQPEGGARFTPSDLSTDAAPADTAFRERYKQRVSFLHPVYVLPPGVADAEVRGFHRRLLGLDPLFRKLLLRSESDGLVGLVGAEAAARLHAGVPLQWMYLGFENGLLVNYPGNASYPPDYDARRRPWYVWARGTHGLRWREPYPDATGSGYLLPCNKALYDEAGRFLGVAGADLSLDRVIDSMEVPGLEGLEEAYLLDDQGRLLVSSRERGVRTEVDVRGDRGKETRSIGVAALEARARAGSASGFVQAGDQLYVYAKLQALPWLLVVRLDAGAALGD
jgi:serine/threonine-protein kinase